MDRQEVENIIQQSNDRLMEQFSSLISNRINSLKRSSEASSEEQLKEIKRLKSAEVPPFKKKSNEEQFKATKDVLNTIEDAQFYLEKGNFAKTKESLDKGKSLIKDRQKLILLADKSPYGWKTVVEYKQHDLADDEEDEKKIYRAEARAARNVKKFSQLRNPNKPKSTTAATQEPIPTLITHRSRQSYNPIKSGGVCFSCGKPGHWRSACPLNTSSASQPK